MTNDRVFALIFASVYPHYVKKAETKGRTKDELDQILRWLTGYTRAGLETGQGTRGLGGLFDGKR